MQLRISGLFSAPESLINLSFVLGGQVLQRQPSYLETKPLIVAEKEITPDLVISTHTVSTMHVAQVKKQNVFS
jgi:hypothetical protein